MPKDTIDFPYVSRDLDDWAPTSLTDLDALIANDRQWVFPELEPVKTELEEAPLAERSSFKWFNALRAITPSPLRSLWIICSSLALSLVAFLLTDSFCGFCECILNHIGCINP